MFIPVALIAVHARRSAMTARAGVDEAAGSGLQTEEGQAAADSDLDELVDVADPYACPTCLNAADACDFHDGFGQGWDACAAFIARRLGVDPEAVA
jgi:hypothetical protein